MVQELSNVEDLYTDHGVSGTKDDEKRRDRYGSFALVDIDVLQGINTGSSFYWEGVRLRGWRS